MVSGTSMQAIVLAAGKSTRFKTGKSKLIEKICGQELILYPTRLLTSMGIPTSVVVGFCKDQLQEIITRQHGTAVTFIQQDNPQGTGHAISCTQSHWSADHILIINGDMPLVTSEIIEALYKKHISSAATISFVVAHNIDPTTGYGRLVKDATTVRIIEAREFTGDANEHCCINAGIYIVKKEFLEQYIHQIVKHDENREFYFTDIIKVASDNQERIETISAPFDRIRGINTLQELWAAEHIKRAELVRYWMDEGVRFCLAPNVHIDLDVVIGAGSYIGSGVHLFGTTKLGNNCVVQAFSTIENSTIGNNATVHSHTVIKDSVVGDHAQVGPFAHIRQQTQLDQKTIIGNFVEVKNSTIGAATKAKHLTYVGDAHIGQQVNIGAGTITCNHDGTSKQVTTIEDNAYIGSNTILVAPVTVHQGAFTAAGSVITQDVPADALAIARARQMNKEHYASVIRSKEKQKKNEQDPSFNASFIGAVKTTTSDTSCSS